MRYFLLIIFLLFGTASFAKNGKVFWLNKDNILKEANRNSPTMNRIKSSLFLATLDQSQNLEKYQPKLAGDFSHYKTNQTPFIAFSPVESPVSKLSLGVTKDFSTGMSMGVYNNLEKRKYDVFGTDARNYVSVEFTMDLYKDIFGSTSRSQIKYLGYEKDIASFQKKIDEEIFLVNLNKIYWAIILNEEAINISKVLLKIAKKQERDIKKRYNDGISDLEDLVRQSSQVASRQLDISNLKNKRELYILDLKKLIPSIADMNVKIAKYDLESQDKWIKRFIADIGSKRQLPKDYTYYDEIVELIGKSYKYQKKVTKNYSDMDLELYSQYDHFGRDSSGLEAFNNTYGSAQNAYTVGVRASIPIGNSKNKSKIIKDNIQKADYLASKREIMANIESYHTQTIKNIKILQEALKYQNNNASGLKKVTRLSKKKYRQARISLNDLINDQDLYLKSLLTKNDIKLSIINQVLDYLTVFTSSPYSFAN